MQRKKKEEKEKKNMKLRETEREMPADLADAKNTKLQLLTAPGIGTCTSKAEKKKKRIKGKKMQN